MAVSVLPSKSSEKLMHLLLKVGKQKKENSSTVVFFTVYKVLQF